jgi:hypothetical protein
VTFTDATIKASQTTQAYTYRVAAANVAGLSAYATSLPVAVNVVVPPAAPANLVAALQTGPSIVLTWTDNANNETGFVIQRAANGGAFAQIATVPAFSGTGTPPAFIDTVQAVATNTTYTYRVAATNAGGTSAFSNTASATVPALPMSPSNLILVNGPNKNKARSVILTWADNSNNETGFTIQRATNSLFTQGLTTTNVGANVTTFTQTSLSPNTQYWFRIRANNGTIVFTVWVNAVPFPITTNP